MKTIKHAIDNPIINSVTFSVDDDIQSILVNSFTGWITKLCESNDFFDGMDLYYGWSQLQCKVEDDSLHLSVPDGKSFPIQWTDNLSSALESVVFHKFIPESFDLQSNIPLMTDTVLVSKRFHEIPMLLTRSEKQNEHDQHSGWFMASSAADVDISEEENLKLMTLYEAMVKAPHILKYISMPAGTQITFEETSPVFYYQSKPIDPQDDSLLARELEVQPA